MAAHSKAVRLVLVVQVVVVLVVSHQERREVEPQTLVAVVAVQVKQTMWTQELLAMVVLES